MDGSIVPSDTGSGCHGGRETMLQAARAAFEKGERNSKILSDLIRKEIGRSPRLQIEYLEARSLETLELLQEAQAGQTLIAAAVRLGT